MRHIQIKILAIIVTLLISVSSYGQMQQVLKNGFVAATDDGVWYLQDGFNEWVRLDYYRDQANDTTNGVCVSNGVVYTDNLVTLEGYGVSTSRSILAVYGNKISEGDRGGREINVSQFKTQTLTSGFKQYKSIVRLNYDRTTSNMAVLINYPPTLGATEYYYVNSDVQYYSSCSGDEDSIFVWTGTNNILYSGIVTEITANRSMSTVSGLHSRQTDSHQICYNPDDDEFIIVSDSGIVYSYNKTSITTIDTISSINGGYLTGVYDLVYDDIFDRYYISFLDSDGLYDVQSFTIPIVGINGNSNIISPSTPYCLSVNSKGDVLALSKNICYKINRNHGGAIEIENIGGNIIVFDLDYINYMP